MTLLWLGVFALGQGQNGHKVSIHIMLKIFLTSADTE